MDYVIDPASGAENYTHIATPDGLTICGIACTDWPRTLDKMWRTVLVCPRCFGTYPREVLTPPPPV